MEQVLKRIMPGTGDEISILGFGCMRFKRSLGSIDMEKAERLIRLAIDAGINYFDTAYLYPGSEKAIGAILAKTDEWGVRLRDRVFVATKLPQQLVKTREEMDRMLETSLERLGMDRVDYYLVHSLGSIEGWERLKKLGVIDFLEKAKADGKIVHIGFSWHGNLQNFRKVIDDYDWEFCQIQYNYLDENFQAGTGGLEYAAEKGIGVIVMEPLRGGQIVGKIPAEAGRIFDNYADASGNKRTPADWAFRWVWNHPEVTLALSGMNEDSQVDENIRSASDALPGALSESDLEMIGRVRDVFHHEIRINCTGCAYCMPCPYGVDIPFCFSALNSYAVFGGMHAKVMYNFSLRKTENKPSGKASVCKKCGACEKKCPQDLPIIKTLEETAKTMEGPLLNAAVGIAGKFMKG